ncbi:putative late blight resistance protein homolog R1B-16 [Lycium barbarum]|uniref:putative late blight resistance protein homolog R1B-16 n=1 Tax=Lycium barbarum TaxID=112863 RepID=UPI00293EBE6E|nr:putative late blight resistance protein homolog R1B-16 [Lycium barbarum]
MAQNDIDHVLDHLRRIERIGDLRRGDLRIADLSIANLITLILEMLEMRLRLLRTFIKYHHIPSPESLVKITKIALWIVEKLPLVFDWIPYDCETDLDLEKVVLTLLESIEDNWSLRYNYELNDSDLSEYMDCLDKNLNDVLMFLEWTRSDHLEWTRSDHLEWIRSDHLEWIRSDHSLTNEKILEITLFRKQLKIVQKKMRFLRYLYVSEINGYVDHEKLEGLETRIQLMADNVGDFCLAFWSIKEEGDVDDTSNIKSKPPYLLGLIVLVELEMKKIFLGELKASKFTQSRTFKDKKLPKGFSHHLHSLLMYLRNQKLQNFPNSVSAQNIDVAIEFLLVFLDADVSNHVINGTWLNEVMEKVGAIAGDVRYVIQKLLPRSINEDDISKINICSIQILEKTKDLNAQVETYYKSLKFTPSQFPMVGGLSFLDSVLRKLNEMSKSESGLVFVMKPDISNLVKELSSLTSILEKELSSLSSIFRDVAKVYHDHEHENLKDLQRRTINLACEAEVAIDSILAHYNAFWHIFCSLPTILKEIKHINAEVTEMWSADVALKPYYVVAPTKHLPTQHSNSVNDEEVVGFEIAVDELIQYLTRGTSELDVIPIVAMGGQGKTTCARKLYNNDIIVSHFDIQAWCIISQTYNRRELLQEICGQVTNSKDKTDKDDILADKLRKSLMGKRYLIVLDDMWDGMAWDDLSLCFPDVVNRSRIVVTTRLEKVGEYVKHHTDLYFLPFLTPDESCRLLQKKVFQKEGCPPELQKVSLAVAKRCKGLPLVVVLVAGIIKTKKMEASWWREVKTSLLSSLGGSEDYSLSTMQLSYDNLPDYLKPCLLYMGMFPEDERIPVSKLISLWIAEGFLQNIESGRSMEEAAEDYLMDLISSNVVMVSKREYNGKVKYCEVHDVVLHFCLEKSREEKFMLVVKGNRSQFQPSDWNESRVSFSFSEALSSKTRKPFHQHLRSLITTNHARWYDWNPLHGKLGLVKVLDLSYGVLDLSYGWNPFHQSTKLRLVKVLDLSSCEVGPLSLATLNPLIHLKYLAVETAHFDFHPESHLPHLETFIVKCFMGLPKLPANFWKMEKLRHVEINLRNKQGIFEESSKLENLRLLRNVIIETEDVDSVDVLLGRCPNLQELEITFRSNDSDIEDYSDSEDSEDDSLSEDDSDSEHDSVEICPKLESLIQLQILHLYFHRSLIVSELHLPSNLKKLVLTRTRMEITVPIIAKLPSLEYLQLKRSEFRLYEEWCLGDITFPKLKFLKLVWLRISRWDASEESFPLLETLVIKRCKNLEEIPPRFADIPTLKQIKLIDPFRRSLRASAVKFKKEVEEIEGCDRIDIIIKDRFGGIRKM